ncbi:MAG: lipopolysaccharide biosynthesis protein [Rhodoferax sp.]|jgi:O-antigen/teichoic acid export membrane protein|nr:lipopolysaccharide biosynthesis protein [Rhodoferax sp.]
MKIGASPSEAARGFWRSVSVVLSGSLVAQSIPLLGALIITRLYAPAAFGQFSAWLGAAMLAAVVVTGRFEMALAVVADGVPRAQAMRATLQTTVLACLVLAVVGAVLVLATDWLPHVHPVLVVLFVPATLLVAMTHSWQAWAAAEGQYRNLSWIRILQALTVVLAQIAAAFVSPTAMAMAAGHVLGLAAGVAVAAALMPVRLGEAGGGERIWPGLQQFWRAQRRFPLLALPADTINTASGQLPILLIASQFGAEASGLFALTLRVLGAPIGLLGAAILDVFKRSAAASYRETGNCRSDYLRTFWLLAAGGVALAVGVIWLAEPIFVLAFGERWRQAGVMAVWLMPMFAMRFVASPLSYVFYIAEKQHVDLIWQCLLLAMTLTAFLVPDSLRSSLLMYAGGYSVLYVVYAALSFHYSKGSAHDRRN